jgi:glycosyltransferase involved in cell wall biosynthesis
VAEARGGALTRPTAQLVSVVVPVYDGARFLAQCLDSLVAQDHPAVEVVVVDDGSTDESAAIAARYAEHDAAHDNRPAVRLLRRPHEGLGATRNAGIAAAAGDLIAFCDADDWWLANKASAQAAHLAAHPDVDIVLCRQDTHFEPGAEQPDWLIPDQRYGDLDGVSPTSGLFRRAVFDRLQYRTDMPAGSDFDLLVRARAAGFRIEVLDDVLRVRRIHGDNMTDREGPAFDEMFRTVRAHLREQR